MAEIRQLLNIIEQLEKKLGLEAGHSMRLRLEKDSLHDMLKKSSTFDAWDRMMSSGKSDSGQATPTGTLVRTFCLSVLLNSHFFRGGGGRVGRGKKAQEASLLYVFLLLERGRGEYLLLHTLLFFGDQALLSHEIYENTFFNQ